mgnify:CR=1 FL=1
MQIHILDNSKRQERVPFTKEAAVRLIFQFETLIWG